MGITAGRAGYLAKGPSLSLAKSELRPMLLVTQDWLLNRTTWTSRDVTHNSIGVSISTPRNQLVSTKGTPL